MSPRATQHASGNGRQSQFVNLDLKGGVLRARLVGPVVGQREAPIIAEELGKAIDVAGRGLRVLVLDLRDVRAMASMGLGTCIEVRNRAREFGAVTVLYRVNDELMALIKMVKVDRLYKLAETEEELTGLLAA